MFNLNDPLAVLATRLPWSQIEAAVSAKFEHQNRTSQVLKDQDMFGTTETLVGAGRSNLTQDIAVKLKDIVVDLGFRGVDADNPDREIIHRGKFKSLSVMQKKWLKRRTGVEPAIGQLKFNHRMDRCRLLRAIAHPGVEVPIFSSVIGSPGAATGYRIDTRPAGPLVDNSRGQLAHK